MKYSLRRARTWAPDAGRRCGAAAARQLGPPAAAAPRPSAPSTHWPAAACAGACSTAAGYPEGLLPAPARDTTLHGSGPCKRRQVPISDIAPAHCYNHYDSDSNSCKGRAIDQGPHRMRRRHRAMDEQCVCGTAGHAVEIAGDQHRNVSAQCDFLKALQERVHLCTPQARSGVIILCQHYALTRGVL